MKSHVYLSFRRGKGPRVRLPADRTTPEFAVAYTAALAGQPAPTSTGVTRATPGTFAALITRDKASPEHVALRAISKAQYDHRLKTIREDDGHRTVAGLSRERISSPSCTRSPIDPAAHSTS